MNNITVTITDRISRAVVYVASVEAMDNSETSRCGALNSVYQMARDSGVRVTDVKHSFS